MIAESASAGRGAGRPPGCLSLRQRHPPPAHPCDTTPTCPGPPVPTLVDGGGRTEPALSMATALTAARAPRETR
jgi:hypothetical protein